jgi:hypothetical protein
MAFRRSAGRSCARAASGQVAAPPSAISISRRPMVTVMRPSRARCVGNDTTPRACCPRRGRSAHRTFMKVRIRLFGFLDKWKGDLVDKAREFELASAVSAARRDGRLSPEVLKSIRRQLGIAHRVLDVLVAEPGL